MFELDDDLATRVFDYCRERLSMNPVTLDHGSHGNVDVPGLHGLIREQGRNPHEVLDLFIEELAELVISIDSPRWLAFIPNSPTKASLLFDMVVSCSGLNGTSWLESAGAVMAENQVLEFLAQSAGMPTGSGGTFVSGGTIANLSALTVGRDVMAHRHPHIEKHRLAFAISEEAHSSVGHALHILGLEPLLIPTTDHRFTLEGLKEVLHSHPRAPEVVGIVATAGTTNAGIIDDLEGLGALARERGWWFHVDGAYGGAGILSPELRPRYVGLRHADSFVVDPHKWLFAPLDCAGLIYREPHLARAVHAQQAGYLDALHTAEPSVEWNPSDYAIHLSRRARGLALWFSLSVHGTDAYATAINRGVELAHLAARKIQERPELELLREPELTNVLFRRVGWKLEDYNRWSQQLLASQVAFVTPSTWEGETCARLSFLHPDLEVDVIDVILDAMGS
jgi:glutamate/tyrosine decarboxylase-like PLP-dependent enzyme